LPVLNPVNPITHPDLLGAEWDIEHKNSIALLFAYFIRVPSSSEEVTAMITAVTNILHVLPRLAGEGLGLMNYDPVGCLDGIILGIISPSPMSVRHAEKHAAHPLRYTLGYAQHHA
jgi:hypothetical protein